MATLETRLLALELATAPKTLPLLTLTLCRAVKSDDDTRYIDGLPFEREPGEAWDSYKARAVLWFQQNPGDSCVSVITIRYKDDAQ